jgi:hypothetical protein
MAGTVRIKLTPAPSPHTPAWAADTESRQVVVDADLAPRWAAAPTSTVIAMTVAVGYVATAFGVIAGQVVGGATALMLWLAAAVAVARVTSKVDDYAAAVQIYARSGASRQDVIETLARSAGPSSDVYKVALLSTLSPDA